MKFYLILTLLSAFSGIISGQAISVDNDTVPEMPSFPGGPDAMYRFIFENIHYPASARKNGIQGKVIVKFNVGPEGDLQNIHIERGIGYGCDEEAMRVIVLMNEFHRWKPGMLNGQPVVTTFTVPIVFSLR